MCHRSFARFLAIATVILLPAAAWSQQWSRPGPYIGVAGDVAFTTKAEDELEDATGIPIDVDPSLGLHARLGYRFGPRFAAEAHYEWVSGFDVSAFGINALEIDGSTVTADAKVFLATERIQPFLLVGVGAAFAEVKDTIGAGFSIDESDFAARFGGGLDLYLTENVALDFDASYVLPTGDLEDFDYVSLGWGLLYRF